MTECRVCLDARGILLAEGTGIATYAAALAACLPLAGWTPELLAASPWDPASGRMQPLPRGELARVRRWAAALDPRPRTAILGPQQVRIAAGLPPTRLRTAPDVFRTAQVQFDLYGRFLAVRNGRSAPPLPPPSIAHWTCPLPIRFRDVPNVYAVHDLIPLLHPGLTPIRKERSLRMLQRLGTIASHVVTGSETARLEILNALGWRPDRVTNAYHAITVSPRDAPAQAVQDAAAALGLEPGAYFLHVGQVERRKNIARLVAAYRESGIASPLVLLGPDGWRASEELATAAGLLRSPGPSDGASGTAAGPTAEPMVGPAILRVPWLPRADALALMRGARAVLLPSLAEGFGLPIVEAMALGTPAMTSSGGATAEVAGDAALLVDPFDVRSIATGLRALDRNAELRAALAEQGLRRARLFQPDAYAARLAELYRGVLADPLPGIAARSSL